jgi:hypothetical protein
MSTMDSPVAVLPELHAWEAGAAASAEALTAWVSARLEAHEAALAALLAVKESRTPENSLRLYDEALEQLSLPAPRPAFSTPWPRIAACAIRPKSRPSA